MKETVKEYDIDKMPMTDEMKYIKWPKAGKVATEMISVILGSAVIAMLIAAGDEIGIALLHILFA